MRTAVCEQRLCTGCRACCQVCPQNAIEMSENEEGFLYPSINNDICNNCGLCERTCPVNSAAGNCGSAADGRSSGNRKLQGSPFNKAYACYSGDENIRAKSSSGGVFSMLAAKVLAEGGVVFGADFDGEFRVRHAFVESEKELDRLRRSKYVQSDIGNTFREASDFLKLGRKVMFCGTPCQIAGLKAYLGREYPALLTCDLACHGVPSPLVWRMYLEFIKDKYKSALKSVSFRDKSTGWNDSSMRIEFKNGSRYMDRVKRETFFIGFGKSIFSRKSCFDCRFRIGNTKADITLADFWGIDRQGSAEYSDNKGVSLVITHTQAGEAALSAIDGDVCVSEREFDEAVRYNPRLVSSVNEPAGRKSFFSDLSAGYDFEALRRKYMDNDSFKYRAKCMLKKVLGRLRT